MKKPIRISASLSCADLLNLQTSLDEIHSTSIDFIHYDVVDGEFNNCFVFGDLILEKIRPVTHLPIEVHLACNQVEKYIEPFIRAGANYIAIHYELDIDKFALFKRIKALGAKPILAFKADTDVPHDFIDYAKEVEWILKLTVNPGYAGQKIQQNAINHIRVMRDLLDRNYLRTDIQADGNINVSTIPLVVQAGATILTGGTSGLFRKGQTINQNAKDMIDASKQEII